MRYVSVGRRFVAYIIDSIVLGLVTAPFGSYKFEDGTASYRVVGVPFLLSLLVCGSPTSRSSRPPWARRSESSILVWSSPTRQRLGDRAASTFVVRKDSVGAPALGDPAASRAQAPPPPPPPGATG